MSLEEETRRMRAPYGQWSPLPHNTPHLIPMQVILLTDVLYPTVKHPKIIYLFATTNL